MKKTEIILTITCVFLALYCFDLKIRDIQNFKERGRVIELKIEYQSGIQQAQELVYELQMAKAKWYLHDLPVFDSIRNNLNSEYSSIQHLNLAQKINKYTENSNNLGGN